ncbi:LPS-assembly protein LptD [Parvularcula dongshanensis]|uniref:LPS-assembly protein LptD n=1 Tax=Parvularcula dongshanensis TaxID=1173995 RepID=A0A840I538_9PROT|nr:LPS assembly protein LptD [Parvularcula dongshanensis]MBB4660076.1 LPS-assembly protein [Parvularcula dongshanensis]
MAVSRIALAAAFLGLGTTAARPQDISVTAEGGETVLFRADAVVRETADGPIVATGNVRANYGGRYLTADQVIYDPRTEIVTASGNVAIYEETGEVYFADEVDLTEDLGTGVATNFSALLAGDSRLAGSSVSRQPGRNDLNNAVYTACEVCTEEGNDRTPTWQIKALRVTQDEEEKVIRFRNAFVEVLGVPIFYTPYFQIADPSVERQSGFLTPSIGTSSRRGFEAEVPYYWSISDYQDVTFSPRLMTDLGVLAKGEYRLRTHDGGVVIQPGIINPSGGDTTQLADIPDTRWHFFGNAFKELDDDWQAELDVNFVSDDLYLREYDIEPEGELRDAVDILQPDRLTSELALTRRRPDSFTDVSAITFQSLRRRDDDSYSADALPRITHQRSFGVPRIGGELSVLGNFLYLNRQTGLDTARGVLSATYEKAYTTRSGHRLRGFAQLRGDVYRFEDANLGIESCRPRSDAENAPLLDNRGRPCIGTLPREGTDDGFTTTRVLPTVGAEWSMPLVKLTDSATYIIEPRVQLALSPDKDYSRDVFNEDSQFFQFDTVTLFDWSKSSGFDQWEDGQRLNVGISGTAVYGNGVTLSGLLGQQFRVSETTAFDRDTGLGDTQSDYVGNLDLRVGSRFSFDNRFRFDKDNFTLNRAESNLRANVGRLSGNLSYLRVETQNLENVSATAGSGRRDEYLTTALAYRLTDRWTIGGNWREDLENGATTAQTLLLRYQDQCTIFTINYRFDNTTVAGLDQNRSLTFNIDFTGF